MYVSFLRMDGILPCSQSPFLKGTHNRQQLFYVANERWCYIVTSSLIGWAHKQNDPRIDMPHITNDDNTWCFFFEFSLFYVPS